MKKIAILQSNYIPWKGYFDLISSVDEFIIFDDMQYTRRDWRNRNKIKTSQGVQWITIPVRTKGNYLHQIREIEIEKNNWNIYHWKTLLQSYAKAPYLHEIASWLEPLYFQSEVCRLSEVNRRFIEAICLYLNIETRITNSWDYKPLGSKSERLVDLCAQAGGTHYISGPSAKSYVDESLFTIHGIELTWFSYLNYPTYNQLWGDFVHEVTILDLLFNCGKSAPKYMKHVL